MVISKITRPTQKNVLFFFLNARSHPKMVVSKITSSHQTMAISKITIFLQTNSYLQGLLDPIKQWLFLKLPDSMKHLCIQLVIFHKTLVISKSYQIPLNTYFIKQ